MAQPRRNRGNNGGDGSRQQRTNAQINVAERRKAYYILLFFGLLLVGLVMFVTRNSVGSSSSTSNPSYPTYYDPHLKIEKPVVSSILKSIISFCEILLQHQSQVEELVAEDTFVDIVKQHVKPAMDKVASIRAQTQIYEGMERIPGGPTNFIESSLKTLEAIDENELAKFREEGGALITRKLGQIVNLVNDGAQLLVHSTDVETVEVLSDEGIRINPDIDPDDIDQIDLSPISFRDLITLFSKLTSYYEHLEESVKELSEALEKYHINADNFREVTTMEIALEITPIMDKYNAAQEQVNQEILKNGNLYQLMLPHRQIILSKIQDTSQVAVYKSSRMVSYNNLVRMVTEDIAHAKERLQNLKRNLPPKKMEL